MLFTIPPELKQYIRADYIIFNTDNKLSGREQEKVRKILKSNMKKFQKDAMFADGCENDPDNPVCKIIINANRFKN